MSRYYVWDAGKETADLWELESNYSTKRMEKYRLQTGVKAVAIVHSLAVGGYGAGTIISPGEFEQKIVEAKRVEAQHLAEYDIEAAIPIVWTAREES